MKEKQWHEFTREEKITIDSEYMRLMATIAFLQEGILNMRKLDPVGAKLLVGRVEEMLLLLKIRMEKKEGE